MTNGSFETPACKILADRLNKQRTLIDTAIKSVGRIELLNHNSIPWVGTGWVVGDGDNCNESTCSRRILLA